MKRVFLAALVATACGASDPVDGTGGTDGPLIGNFTVRLVDPVPATDDDPATPGYTSILGKVFDGASPEATVWTVAGSSGDCRLEKPTVPFCSTPCGGSAVCVATDTCTPYPTAKEVGKVTVSGVRTASGGTSFTMTPLASSYQPPAAAGTLPYPAFAESGQVTFKAAGSDFTAAFTLRARGVAPLVLGAASYPLVKGQPLALTWTAPAATGQTVRVALDISHHGGSKGRILCDTADDGSLTVAAELVSQLLDLGIAGFPTVIVTRSATGSTNVATGHVELAILSIVERPVTIAGLRSCTEDEECPEDQTCQSDLTCKESP